MGSIKSDCWNIKSSFKVKKKQIKTEDVEFILNLYLKIKLIIKNKIKVFKIINELYNRRLKYCKITIPNQ